MSTVIAAAWPGRNPAEFDPDRVEQVRALAKLNQVEGAVARHYRDWLSDDVATVDEATAAFDANLEEAATLLDLAGIRPILIKCVPGVDHVYSNFDLVVGDSLPEAVQALAGWGIRTSTHPLEHSKVLVYPAAGPAAHLHTAAAWWDVPAVDTERLRARATGTGPWLIPAESDQLRIWVAHAVFQNLAFDLSELLALRSLLRQDVIDAAALECRREGWEGPYRRALRVAERTVDMLDRGENPPLPVALPVRDSLAIAEHVRYLATAGQPRAALRELVLRAPLVLAKKRRARRNAALASADPAPAAAVVVGFSGPDGSGKSSLVEAVARAAERQGAVVRRTYLFGCVVCRNVRAPALSGGALSGRGAVGRRADHATPRAVLTPAQIVHAYVDLLESKGRLWWSVRQAQRAQARDGRLGYVLADRTPLDSMVKHDLPAGRALDRWRSLAGRFTMIAVLDAPSEVLSRRDGQHRADDLEVARSRFRHRSKEMDNVVHLASGDASSEVLAIGLLSRLQSPD
ncbi:hypothetical protein [Blastococcus sp. SYSU DS0973]